MFESCRPDFFPVYYVYVLRSEKTGRLYTGSCEDIEDRLTRHNSGRSMATKHGVPWQLVYSEEHASRADAAQREKYFKTGKGRDELTRLLG